MSKLLARVIPGVPGVYLGSNKHQSEIVRITVWENKVVSKPNPSVLANYLKSHYYSEGRRMLLKHSFKEKFKNKPIKNFILNNTNNELEQFLNTSINFSKYASLYKNN